jgi:uncharacterized protein YjbJ (UPF0337 family)
MWNKDEVKGKTKRLKGRMKESAGNALDDERLRDEGAADQISGASEETLGRGRRKVGEAVEKIGKTIKR